MDPLRLALFEKRFEGDDALMELARLRFQQAGLGAEMHGGTSEQLEWSLRFRPSSNAPVVVHLPRDLNLANPASREQIAELAARFARRVYGLLLHDHRDLVERPGEYFRAAEQLQSRLDLVEQPPVIFIEYAAGLEPGRFADFFKGIRNLPGLSACIDVGHVGIQRARDAYAGRHPGEDICALKEQPARLPEVLPEVEWALATALPAVLELINSIGSLGKPVHFHLHDGHPLSTASPFGVSDHLSFLAELPLGFESRGRRAAPLMYGPAGLAQIVGQAMRTLGPERLSLSLEIHPVYARLPLGDAAPVFAHWTDLTTAEQMNHWLVVLRDNHDLIGRILVGESGYGEHIPCAGAEFAPAGREP